MKLVELYGRVRYAVRIEGITGVLPCIPKTLTSSSAGRGLFTRRDFFYDAAHDHYTCPAGQHLTRATVRSDRRDDIDHYRHLTAC